MSILSATVKPAAITALILGLAMPTLAHGDDTRFEVTPFAGIDLFVQGYEVSVMDNSDVELAMTPMLQQPLGSRGGA